MNSQTLKHIIFYSSSEVEKIKNDTVLDSLPLVARSNNKEQWNKFVIENKGSFLQSWQWGEFQQALGRKIWRLAEKNWQALVIKYPLPLGKGYLYCPRGPIINSNLKSQISLRRQSYGALATKPHLKSQNFLNKIAEIVKQERVIFLRVDPVGELGLEKFGFKSAPPDYYFSATAASPVIALLKIDFSEEEILQKMKPKTRYNLHLAERKGVKVTMGGDELLDIFYNLLKQTAQREKFKPHLKEHYQKLLDAFGKQIYPTPFKHPMPPASKIKKVFERCGVKIFLAQYQGQPLAASMVLFFGQTAHYLHGASAPAKRYLMPTYLLHWQAIQEAKKLNCQFYDFGGVAPTDDSKHPWSGIDRFKMGFGAKRVNFPWAQDLIFQSIWYKIYNIARKLK